MHGNLRRIWGFFICSSGVQILVNLITDCPQEVQSLAAANLANMAKSSLGRNILKRNGGLQKLVRLHIKFRVADRGDGLISDSFLPSRAFPLICFVFCLKVTFVIKFARFYQWVSPNVCQNPTFFEVTRQGNT